MKTPDEKEYWLTHQVEPEVELDKPLNDLELAELQDHLRDYLDDVATDNPMQYLKKFLEKRFI